MGVWEGQGRHCCVGTGDARPGLWWCHFPCPYPTALPGGSRGVQPAESISSHAGTAPHDSHTVATLLVGFAGPVLVW